MGQGDLCRPSLSPLFVVALCRCGIRDTRCGMQVLTPFVAPLCRPSLSIGARPSAVGCVSTDRMIDSGAVGLQSDAEGHSVAAAATGSGLRVSVA